MRTGEASLGHWAHAPERAVAHLWRRAAAALGPLDAGDGSRFTVLYPGRPGGGPGPDFRDALLLRDDGSVVRGDVEVHVRERGWLDHGHGRDRRYNRMALHVVLWPTPPAPLDGPTGRGPLTRLEMGAVVPVVALFPSLARLYRSTTTPSAPSKRTAARHSPRPQDVSLRTAGRTPLLAPEAVSPEPDQSLLAAPQAAALTPGRLLRAGLVRFHQKARAFTQELSQSGPEEVLYQGVMETLGYSGNREAMRSLAMGLPLALLRRALLPVPSEQRRTALEALLVGAAGLLPQSPDLDATALAGIWRASGLEAVVPQAAWSLAGLRPSNHPRRRLLGMAGLLHRFWETGLLEGLLPLVKLQGPPALERALAVDCPDQAQGATALIGAGRAREAAVNVVLPFFYAYGGRTGGSALARAALALYRAFPAPEENSQVREARRVLGVAWPVPTACGQQGLLGLYRRLLSVAPSGAR